MDTFELLTNRKIDIGLLKETHSISEGIQKWEKSRKENPFRTPDPFLKHQV